MKRAGNNRILSSICVLILLALCLTVPCSAAESPGTENPDASSAAETEQVLKLENGLYHCYENGKLVTRDWRVIDEKTYYFKANGAAAVLSCKIGSKYYIFNKKGQLLEPKKKSVVTVGKAKYHVTPKGTAAKGWSADKKYYSDNTGKCLTGIRVLKEKFYAFGSSGKYNKTKTTKLRKAAKYEKNISTLKKLIGKPKKTKYYSSCYGDGKDGVWTYSNFKVYTFKPRSGKEIFMGAEG